MKKIKIQNKNLFALVDDEVYEKLHKYKWYISCGYAVYGSKDNNFKSFEKMHRIIMNAKKGEIIDHIDGNKLNNQKNNLRFCTSKQNKHNSKKISGTKNKYKGVSYVKKLDLYQSRCRINGKDFFLGYYETNISAAYAYNKKASEESKYSLLNNLEDYSKEELEYKLKNERKVVKKYKGSKYKYIAFRKKSGRMKCDKFCIYFTINKKTYTKGYFFTEIEALKYLKDNYSHLLNDIGALKKH